MVFGVVGVGAGGDGAPVGVASTNGSDANWGLPFGAGFGGGPSRRRIQ